jgi:hypothetical protein
MTVNLWAQGGDWPTRRGLLREGRIGLVGDGRHHGASVASRWPIGQVHEVDLHLNPRTGDYSCGVVCRALGVGLLDEGSVWSCS